MPKKYTKKECREIYEKLPPKIKELFWDEDVSDRIEKVIKRFNLGKIKGDRLNKIIFYVFLGLLPPSLIKRMLKEKLALSEKESEELGDEVIRYIIAPMKHLLKMLYKKEEFEKVGIKSDFYEKDTETERKKSPQKKEETSKDSSDPYREPVE